MLPALLLTRHLGHRGLVVGIGGCQILGIQLIKVVVVLDGDRGAALGVVSLQLSVGKHIRRLDMRICLVACALI